jgi:signal transduction histidine kinase/CheY-like chemotaxis protein
MEKQEAGTFVNAMNKAVSSSTEFLTGGGEMGQLIRATQWADTPVGTVGSWPATLRTMVRVMLDAAFPMYIAWGSGYTQFYNDAYRPILGATKHPGALGNSTRQTFAEIWPIIGPMFDEVMQGKAVGLHDFLLPLDRFGYTEECYFTLSYSPIRDERNEVGGVLVTVTETTEQVLANRRLRMLRKLAERAATVDTLEQASGMIALTLHENPYDIPFALFYRLENEGKTARLTENVRFPEELLDHQRHATLNNGASLFWPLGAVAASGTAQHIEINIAGQPALGGGAWPEETTSACVMPVTRPERDYPFGVLVIGISPRRTFDENYSSFLALLTEHAATALANATAYEADRQRTAALLEIDRLKTAFFSNISHEFRTPLTLMIGPLEDAIAETTDPRERERLDLVLRNALRILKLVNNLLDFARLESGRADAVFEPTDICSLTADVASSFRSAVERAGMKFEVDCPPFEEPVYIDRQLWEKVVLNLLSNAFKFTFRGTIAVHVTRRPGAVMLSVSDTGIGIPDEEVGRVFERFHRVHNANSRTHEGSGIGLALVQEIARLHGGTVTVRSQEGVGSTFTVTIPTGKAHLPADKIETTRSLISTAVSSRAYVEEALHWLPDSTKAARAPLLAFGKPYVLVVDDNADMRTYISRILEAQYNVDTAHDGEEALNAIRQRRPDLVLADVMMPRIDGFGLLKHLRDDADTQTLPVILLSARAGEEARVEGLRRGADDYLVKPFSARELLTRVGTTFRLAQLRQRSQTEFQNLVMQSPVAVGVLKGPELALSIANDSLLGLWHCSREVIGRPLEAILPELKGQEFLSRLRAVQQSGEPYQAHEEKICFEHHGALCDRYFSYVAQPLFDDEGGIAGVTVLINEVTPQARVNRQLAESEARVRVAIESAELGTWEYDPVADRIHYSERTRVLFGLPTGEDVSLERAASVIETADRARVLDAIRQALEPGSDGNYDVEYALITREKGLPRMIRAKGKAFFDDHGRPYRLLGTVMDITDQKRHEQLLRDLATELESRVQERTRELQNANLELVRSNKELEQFAYVASHDMREPLRKITVFGDRLIKQYRDLLSGDGELYISRMQDSAHRMEQLIDDLLNFSRVARASGLYEPVDLNDVVARVLRDLEIALDKNNAVVEVATAPLPTIEANGSQLEKFFLNMLSNALKFAREGVQPRIEIRHELISAEESGVNAPKPGVPYLRLMIRDNGIGFEQEYAERIFGLFQRLHGRSDYQGSGIGLAICRKIAENHQGIVRAEGRPGEGATFMLVLPVRQG